MKEKFIIPITIIVTSLILGGFFYATQVSKQRSIERQEILKIDNEKEKEQQEKEARQLCFEEAENKARELLKKKVAMYPDNTEFKKGIENDLYLKDDFSRYYEDCLSKNGLQK